VQEIAVVVFVESLNEVHIGNGSVTRPCLSREGFLRRGTTEACLKHYNDY